MHPSESLAIEASDPDFVRVHYEKVLTSSVTLKNELVLERGHVGYVAERLAAAAGEGGAPRAEARLGSATIVVYESGDPDRPYYNVHCRRDPDAPAPGLSTVCVSAAGVRRLIELLRTA